MCRADDSLNYFGFLFPGLAFPGLKSGATKLIEPMALQKDRCFVLYDGVLEKIEMMDL